jgi:predicted enzyme related to lactoylglutathione lyase
MNEMNPVVHFEMPYKDKRRMADFYAKAFGWKARMLGPEMGEYVVAETSQCDGDGTPKERGRINGGFYKRPDDAMGQCPSVVLGVGDIKAALDRIRAAGGRVLGEPMMIPGVGMYCSFVDTEGNRASVIEPIMRPGTK